MKGPSASVSTPYCRERIQLLVHGVVQGMGFRPFVFRLAHQCSLAGWVANTPQGAILELEGTLQDLGDFQASLQTDLPQPAIIHELIRTKIPAVGEQTFVIRPSQSAGMSLSVISPDLATCEACVRDITDPQSRRYRYPFTTCAQCGPRYSILLRLPYDRVHTTMNQFPPCPACQKEYAAPSDLRFHAETIACPSCGPQVACWDREGTILAHGEEALRKACDVVRDGDILAVKGLGGFQLWVNAQSSKAVQQLRRRKHRPAKPFAVMFPSLDLLAQDCMISPEEMTLVTSSAAPIVLLKRAAASTLAFETAPGNPYLGAMLPFTPLHHLLMADLNIPVIATSGNRSEEPLVFKEQEALPRLQDIADAFLVHNRPITRPLDDSVVRVVNGKPAMLRRARGYVPTPLAVPHGPNTGERLPQILGMGGHLKNTIAVVTQEGVCVSQHIGDLSTPEASAQCEHTVTDVLTLFNLAPQAVACDSHPDYRSTGFARRLGRQRRIPVIPVQHHFAHIAACMAEYGLQGPVLGAAWDGAGYGSDRTLWGGEFLLCDSSGFQRIGHLRPFSLPGGEICMREPRRVALSFLHQVFEAQLLDLDLSPLHSLGQEKTRSLVALLDKKVQCPVTSSVGRLFDGVSSLLGLNQIATFEGEAAMALEFLAERKDQDRPPHVYHIPLESPSEPEGPWAADWRPLLADIVRDILRRKNFSEIAYGFHLALARLIGDFADRMKGMPVVLSGGVFQNAILLGLAETLLLQNGIRIFTPQAFGTNDGSIALGQCWVALHTYSARSSQG